MPGSYEKINSRLQIYGFKAIILCISVIELHRVCRSIFTTLSKKGSGSRDLFNGSDIATVTELRAFSLSVVINPAQGIDFETCTETRYCCLSYVVHYCFLSSSLISSQSSIIFLSLNSFRISIVSSHSFLSLKSINFVSWVNKPWFCLSI